MVQLHPVALGHAPRIISSQASRPADPVFAAGTHEEVQTLINALPVPVQHALTDLQASVALRAHACICTQDHMVGSNPSGTCTLTMGCFPIIMLRPLG